MSAPTTDKAHHRTRPLSAYSLQFLAVLVFLLSFAGCYEVSKEVIPTDLGEVMPYTLDHATMDKGGKMYFSRVSFSHDYRFRDESKDSADEPNKTGTFRGMRIKDDIYAVQARYDHEDNYDIVFYRITSNHFEVVQPSSKEAVQALARRYSVKLDDDDDLSGDRSDMLNFLKAHKELDFEKPKD